MLIEFSFHILAAGNLTPNLFLPMNISGLNQPKQGTGLSATDYIDGKLNPDFSVFSSLTLTIQLIVIYLLTL